MTRPLTDQERFDLRQSEAEDRWEKLCGRCGACCGTADGDPCEHLAGEAQGEYFCSIYNNRFGLHKTRSGKPFRCVPIRDILHTSWPGDECCGYKQMIKHMKGPLS